MTVNVRSPDACPALVLNADYRPLSYFPLSLWSWQDAIKAVFMDRVNIVCEYDQVVRSPTFEMKLPSVVSLKTYISHERHPAFTRFNVFLREQIHLPVLRAEVGPHVRSHGATVQRRENDLGQRGDGLCVV